MGGGLLVLAIPLWRFLIEFIFPGDKTSAPDVFSSCSLIPRVHFETRLMIVSVIWLRDMTSYVAGGQAIFEKKCKFFNFFQQ